MVGSGKGVGVAKKSFPVSCSMFVLLQVLVLASGTAETTARVEVTVALEMEHSLFC